MRILITARNGLTGSWLFKNKDKIHGLSLIFHERVNGDLGESKTVKKILEKSNPDIIIHNAAILSGSLSDHSLKQKNSENNLLIFKNILEHLSSNQKLISLSSYHVYSNSPPFLNLDTSILNFNTPYASWKSNEILISKEQKNISFILLPHLFGAYDNFRPGRAHFIADSINRICFAIDHNEDKIEFFGDRDLTMQFATGAQAADFILNQVRFGPNDSNRYIQANIGWVAKAELVFRALLNILKFKGEVQTSNSRSSLNSRSLYFKNEGQDSNVISQKFYNELVLTVQYFNSIKN